MKNFLAGYLTRRKAANDSGNISKEKTKEKIAEFFSRENFSASEVRKIKRLAMKFKIPLKQFKRQFCKFCLSQLKGQIRISKTHKTIICENCKKANKCRLQ